MPRGRPRKQNDDTKNDAKEGIKKYYNNGDLVEIPKQKRKYTRKQKPEQHKTDDDTMIKPEGKKRGRKRGRKKKDQDPLYKPEEILDFMIRNYPEMRIERIKDKVLLGLKNMKDLGDDPYLLQKFTFDNKIFYYDAQNTILNSDGQLVGYFIKQIDGTNKMHMIRQKNRDHRSYQEIIDSIEKR